MGFIDLEKAYDRGIRVALWELLRMHNIGSKLLNGVVCMLIV